MRVRVLGSAAGGGFPQWNCGCPNCRRCRLGHPHPAARSQTQLAVTADNEHWFLLGTSPDLRYQIEGFPELHPQHAGRNSPIAGIVLVGADLDHTLGLLLLREWHRLNIYSTATVRRLLMETNTIFRLLDRMPGQLGWGDAVPGTPFELTTPQGVRTGMTARLISMSGNLPAYAPSSEGFRTDEAVTALILQSPTGGRMAFVPGLPAITPDLFRELDECETILVDGTFWTDDELVRMEGFGRPAREIGHLPVSGPEGSLSGFSGSKAGRKIYIHINNTNPMLIEGSDERRLVGASGWDVAFDGMELAV